MAALRRTRRRVLRDGPLEHDFGIYAESCKWPLERTVPRDVQSAIDHEVLWRASDDVLFDYFEAYLLNDACVLALSTDLIRAEELMATVESDFEGLIFEEGELLDRPEMAESPQELMHAVIRAGLGAPLDFDQEFFDLIVRYATSHDNSFVRETAIYVMIYMEWPEFMPVLREIAATDVMEKVRDRAQIVLEAYETSGIGGGP